MNAPVRLDDVLLAEMLWAAFKALFTVSAILMVMLVVSFWVMGSKTLLVEQISRANIAFREKFSSLAGDELESLGNKDAAGAHKSSSLYRVYTIGMSELQHRMDLYEKQGIAKNLSPQALGAIRASIDAELVRENERLNKNMVLLTIAISGGPFLGLLGTVVGVMITFAAIAAAGDVNVNAIAPGIAAALVATVAGLGVAIPALFGYNYLASRIKSISNETIVFADEMVTRLAETHAN
jgi:biopolymer transport protein ExbB